MKVFALVVTYNRLAELKVCLSRLARQKDSLDHIVIINNNSTDGTAEYLETQKGKYTVINPGKNVGGAGAYNIGLKWCVMNGADWIWCIEDDLLVPGEFLRTAKNWISNVTAGENIKLGYVYPSVLSIHNRRKIDCAIFLSTPGKKLQEAYSINRAQFGGLLINSAAVKEAGLPIKEFFIYYDDWEYTSRISKLGWECYWLSSVYVWHNSGVKPPSKPYLHGRPEEMWKFYYGIRNELAIMRTQRRFSYAKYLVYHAFIVPLKILFRRSNNRFQVAYNWSKWSLKSLFFKFRREYLPNS